VLIIVPASGWYAYLMARDEPFTESRPPLRNEWVAGIDRAKVWTPVYRADPADALRIRATDHLRRQR